MVDWMQRVDSSRSELRELSDLSFARFDSRLSERIAETEARLDVKIARLDAKLEALDEKMDARLAALSGSVDARVGAWDEKMGARLVALGGSVDARIDTRIAELRLEMHSGFARLETLMERHKVELTRWALGFWLASLIGVAGTLVALNRRL